MICGILMTFRRHGFEQKRRAGATPKRRASFAMNVLPHAGLEQTASVSRATSASRPTRVAGLDLLDPPPELHDILRTDPECV